MLNKTIVLFYPIIINAIPHTEQNSKIDPINKTEKVKNLTTSFIKFFIYIPPKNFAFKLYSYYI